MPRVLIGGVVAAVIGILTATVYFVTTSTLEDRIRREVKDQVTRAQNLLTQQASLQALDLLKSVEELARDQTFVRAVEEPNTRMAARRFVSFRTDLASDEPRPDILALVDKKGQVVVLFSGDNELEKPIPDLYMKDGALKYRAIDLALKSDPAKRQVISEVWDYETSGPMNAAVAPVIDNDFGEIEGAVIMAYSVTATQAAEVRDLLGADVAYFYGNRIYATSFHASGGVESEKQQALRAPLIEQGLAKAALDSEGGFSPVVTFQLFGEEYVATALRLQRFYRRPLPDNYPPIVTGAMVFRSVTKALEPVANVKLAILLLGVGALLVALVSMVVTAKTILGPLDEVEVGISEIINGNIDKTFQPVGSDLDGLANALNVMLARLLGRPEPGEEEFDEEGNIIRGNPVQFDPEGLSPKDAEAVRLAQEPEDAYYQRIFDEYVQARRTLGESSEGITRESFAAKLRLNESTLKEKYQCRAVRFKVVTKDEKVTLKPVPIV
jgi:hypothetical protein